MGCTVLYDVGHMQLVQLYIEIAITMKEIAITMQEILDTIIHAIATVE